MLPSRQSLALAAAIALGCCGIVTGGNDPYAAPHCTSPYCGPCFPERVRYGYFPTTWRRWPTDRLAAVGGQQPEALPTPAEPAAPETTEAPIEAPQPDAAEPAQPDALPAEPPFGDVPAMPPSDEGPIQLPFGEEPPPFDDAPPPLPTEPKDSLIPSFDPTEPPPEMPSDMPSDELPAPANSTPPDSDLPPTMPDDDPFKDDPQQDIVPPADPAPKSSAHEALERIQQQATNHRQRPVEPAGIVEPPAMRREASVASPPVNDEPGRLKADEREAQTPPLPGRHENPLRSARRTGRPQRIIPTAGFTTADTATAARRDVNWRPNPLRSN